MEVIQFIMQYNAKTKGKEISKEDDLKLITDMIHPVKYIGFSKKKQIAKNIIKNTVKQDEDLNIIYDGCDKYLYTVLTLINEYTDLNVDENGYDKICSERLLNKIIATFEEEYEVVNSMINIYMQELELRNIDIRGW